MSTTKTTSIRQRYPQAGGGWILGIDGGGSKSAGLLLDPEGHHAGSALSGPANPLHDFERAIGSIRDAARQALQEGGMLGRESEVSVGLGLAGVNLQRLRDDVLAWAHPFKSLHLATDLEIACLGAHAGGEGAVVICGTGSSGFVASHGRSEIIGAQGFPCGDVGSGSWVGLEALRAVYSALDGLGPSTRLSSDIQSHFGGDIGSIMERMAVADVYEYGQLAPLVSAAARAGDAVACSILQRGGEYMSRLVSRLRSFDPPRISLIGGHAPFIREWMSSEAKALLSDCLQSPEMGACHLVKRQQNVSQIGG